MLLNKIRTTTSDPQCCFTTSTTKDGGGHHHAITKYLQDTLGIDDESVHNGIIKAFESIYGKYNVTVEHLNEFDQEDMDSLIQSVQKEVGKKKKKDSDSVSGGDPTRSDMSKTKVIKGSSPAAGRRRSIPVLFKVPHESKEFEVSWKLGDSLLQLSQQNEDILQDSTLEGACGGTMSCCTCHVYLKNQNDYNLFNPPPSENELDMLDLAYEPIEDCSRLGCQVTLSPSILENATSRGDDSTTDRKVILEVTLPSGVNNVWT